MKKIFQYFAIFSVIILTMTSCTSDDNSGSSVVLLKKLTSTSFGTNAQYGFTYNGTKLTKVSFSVNNQLNGNWYDKYRYTGDLITEIKRYNSSNQITTSTVFTYNASNQLTQVVKLNLDNNYGFKTVYQYNIDGSVVATGYYGDLVAQNTLSVTSEKYYFQNGEIVSKEHYSSNTLQFSNAYSYDVSNNPLKNVTGIKAIKIYDFMADGLFGIEHNVIQQTAYDASGNIDNTVSFEGNYNQDSYPTAIYSVNTQESLAYNFEYYK